MLPVLFTIGNFSVYSFGFFLALSFLLSTFVVWKFGKEELKEYEYFDAYLYTSFVALVSARILFIILNWNQFGWNILRFFVVRETPGLSLLGAIAGGGAFLYFYCRRKKLTFGPVADLFSLAFSYGLIFSKIAEQLSGSGFGKETKFLLGIKIVGMTGRRHPVELYEAVFFIFLSILLLILYRKSVRREIQRGVVTAVFLIGLSLSIFSLEFLKETSVYFVGLTRRQIMAGILFIGSTVSFVIRSGVLKKLHKKAQK